ncbi:hypothetical protein [Streptomyces sp. NPDC127092]|uniref:hypothetical protein n=1 Tax=Streptomyces sp. NPDC127092 TaxID=3347135 RepID=UPI0036615549
MRASIPRPRRAETGQIGQTTQTGQTGQTGAAGQVGRRVRVGQGGQAGRVGRAALPVLGAVLLAAAGAAPAAAGGSLVTVIDNSHADSVLEVDRAANLQYGSSGTAGSDHDGSAVDALQTLVGAVHAPDDD